MAGMFRYVALIFDPSATIQSEHAEHLGRDLCALRSPWRRVWSASGIRVFCVGPLTDALRVHHLESGAGVILGTAFDSGIGARVDRLATDIDQETSRAIEQTHGEHLIHRFWGNYVAFLRDPRSFARYVLKDPCGSLPCYLTYSAHVAVVFSCIADCVQLGLKFTPNSNYVRERVVSGGRDRTQEALNEVTPIHGGECVKFDQCPRGRPTARLLWRPMVFVDHPNGYETRESAADALRLTAYRCTHALASPHARVLHRLSGGLDSSIVLGCLHHGPTHPEVTAYTYFMPGTKADERPWARLAAARAHCQHREVAFEPGELRLERLLDLAPDVEPTSLLRYAQRAPLERALANRCEATAVFTGLGGDSGFCSDSSAYALIEYLRLHGPGKRTLEIAQHVARLTQRTLAYVLLRSFWIWLAGEPPGSERAASSSASRLVSKQARGSVPPRERYRHPWCEGAQAMPRAILRRLGALPFAPEFYDLSAAPHENAPEVLSPFYAQPMIELCLRIPLYVHFAEGVDRGLARHAFRAVVPPAILERTWKDRAPGYYEEIVAANRSFLRELLLDGTLVKEQLLDRVAVELALSRDGLRSDVHPGEILRHLDTELWLRKWQALGHARNSQPP